MTLVVFLTEAIFTSFLALSLTDWRARAVDRISPRTQTVTPYIPSASLIWHELVSRVGAFVAASPKDLPRLKKRLIRAGFRSPKAALIFNGVRGLSTVIFTLAAI